MTLNIKEFNPPLTQSWFSMYSSKHCVCALLLCCISTALLFNSLFTVSLTFTLADEVGLRSVTYEAMLEDWFSLSEEPAAPVGKPTNIKTFSNWQYSIYKHLCEKLKITQKRFIVQLTKSFLLALSFLYLCLVTSGNHHVHMLFRWCGWSHLQLP